MAKKFAEIIGIHKIFNTVIEDPDSGTIAYKEMSIPGNNLELKTNIGEDTIVFVTADNTDAGRIIGPNKYKISKDDCFIIAQNKVFGAFGKVNVSDVMGPAGKDGAGVYSLTNSQKIGMINTINGSVEPSLNIEEGTLVDFLKVFVNNGTGLSSTELSNISINLKSWSNVNGINGSFIVDSTLFTRDMNLNNFNLQNYYDLKGDIGPRGPQGPAGTSISMPIGSIIMFAGDEAPADWVFCKGQVIPTIDEEGTTVLPLEKYRKYQSLISVIKDTYYAYDILNQGGKDIESGEWIDIDSTIEGQTVANLVYLPDFSLRFPYGASAPLGNSYLDDKIYGGESSVAVPLKSHSHTYEKYLINTNENSNNETPGTWSVDDKKVYSSMGFSTSVTGDGSNPTIDIIPKYTMINFIIKYK